MVLVWQTVNLHNLMIHIQETQEGDEKQQYVKGMATTQAMTIMRGWISRSFKQALLTRGVLSLRQVKATEEIEVSSFV